MSTTKQQLTHQSALEAIRDYSVEGQTGVEVMLALKLIANRTLKGEPVDPIDPLGLYVEEEEEPE